MSWFNDEVAVEATKEYAQSFSVQTGEFPVKLDFVYIFSIGENGFFLGVLDLAN